MSRHLRAGGDPRQHRLRHLFRAWATLMPAAGSPETCRRDHAKAWPCLDPRRSDRIDAQMGTARRRRLLTRLQTYLSLAARRDTIVTVRCQFDCARSGPLRLLWWGRSNPLAWWWALLSLVSGGNIALWFVLYRQFHVQPTGSRDSASDIQLMLFLCAAYVFGCAFRSVLPRADVQRICLFDTWLSSVAVGRSVATVAEICFAAQWAIVLHQLGGIVEADTTLNVALAIVPLILLAQCCSWYGAHHQLSGECHRKLDMGSRLPAVGIGLCRLLPEFDGLVRSALIVAIIGIAGYLAFLITIDVPMYLSRWQDGLAGGASGSSDGLRDVSTRWIVTHDFAQWRDEIAWMSLYFTAAVWRASRFALFTPRIIFPDIAPTCRKLWSIERQHQATTQAHGPYKPAREW